jgi:Holliday junction resolvase RusA-like endonuclease
MHRQEALTHHGYHFISLSAKGTALTTLIVLPGEPKSTSHIYKMTCRNGYAHMYLSQEGKNIKQQYIAQARKQWKRKLLTGDLQVAIKLFFGTKRKCDWDNFHKLSMDALEGIVWENDNQIQEADVCKFYDKQNPRIEIVVNSLP